MTRYDAELKCIVAYYAKSANERERACAVALDVIRQSCPAACAAQLQSNSEAPASFHQESDAK